MDDIFVKQIPKLQVVVTREILVELKDVSSIGQIMINHYFSGGVAGLQDNMTRPHINVFPLHK